MANELEKMYKDISSLITKRIDYIIDNLPFDREIFAIDLCYLSLGDIKETVYPLNLINIFVQDFVNKSMYGPSTVAYIDLRIADIILRFKYNEKFRILDKYIKKFLTLAKSSRQFRFPKNHDSVKYKAKLIKEN